MRSLILSGVATLSLIACGSTKAAHDARLPDEGGGSGGVAGAGGSGFQGDLTRPMFGSGTRLRAQYADLGSARVFFGWFDTKVSQYCSFGDGTDGKSRCFPNSFAERVYLDDACTHAVLRAPAATSCELPYGSRRTVYLEEPSPPCTAGSSGVAVFELGAKLPGGHWHQRLGTTCSAESSVFTNDLYEMGSQVPASGYVERHAQTEPRSEGLGAVVLKSDDGSFAVWGGEDLSRKKPCSGARIGSEGVNVCLVDNTAFVDPACGAAVISSCAPAPTYLVEHQTPPALCAAEPPLRVFTAGAGSPPSSSCGGSGGSSTAYARGANVPASAFPSMFEVHAGSGPVRTTVFVSARGDAIYPAGDLFDVGRGTPCDATAFMDGTMRCLPSSIDGRLPFYADAACTEPLHAVRTDPCPRPLATIVYEVPLGDCWIVPAGLRGLGPEIVPTTLFYGYPAGTCKATEPEPTTRYFKLGDAVDLATFPEVTVKND